MKNSYWRKGLVFGTIMLLVGTSVVSALGTLVVEEKCLLENGTNPLNFEENIIYVDDDSVYPGNGTFWWPYKYIWQGIENASEGYIVYVYNGIYEETVDVDKRIFLIGQDGHNEGTKIIWDGEKDYIILISVKGVEVNNFYIEGEDETEMGIKSDEECIYVTWNKIVNCDYGIFIDEGDEGSENQICYNIVDGCRKAGIYLHRSNGNFIFGNTVKDISWEQGGGIQLVNSGFNTILHNILKNCYVGVALKDADSHYNFLIFNKFENCGYGIYLYNVGILNLIMGNNLYESEIEWGFFSARSFGSFLNIWTINYCDDRMYPFVKGELGFIPVIKKHISPSEASHPFYLPY